MIAGTARPGLALRRLLLPCTVAGVTVLCLAAPPASAKSDIDVSAVRVAATGGVNVSAFGGDDAAGLQRLCLQQSAGPSWHTLVCGRAGLGTGGRVRFVVPSAGPRPRFRAVLQRIARVPSRPPLLDLTSAPVVPGVQAARGAPVAPGARTVRDAAGARPGRAVSGRRTRGQWCP